MVIGIDASRSYIKNRTGTENYSFQIIRSILASKIARKHKFYLFVAPGYDHRSAPLGDNIEIVLIDRRKLWTQVGLATYTWKKGLDVLFVPAHTLPILRRPGVRTVVTIHGVEYEYLPEYKNMLQAWYLPLSTRYAVAKADQIIAVSEFTKSQIVSRMGADKDKVSVVHEGVDADFFGSEVARSNRSRVFRKYGMGARYMAFVGTIMPRKNLAFMVRVYSRLAREDRELYFVIAGARGWMYQDVIDEIERSQAKDRILMTGRLDDKEMRAILQGASVYVQPSITEGFGLPVLEAMAAGVPVVSSNGGALPEVVGDAGLVIHGFDEDEWSLGISELLASKNQRSELVRRGRKRVSEFDWERAGEKTLKILTNIG